MVRNLNLYYFDVTATDAVVHFDLTTDAPAAMFILRPDVIDNDAGDLDPLAFLNNGNVVFQDEFVHVLKPGRYYVGFYTVNGAAASTPSVKPIRCP